MQRIYELIHSVIKKYPNDDFFQSFESDLIVNKLKRNFFITIENALITLDKESWETLKEKALKHFKGYREGQKKQDFFNHLNEAFAYQYLTSRGYSAIKILIENNKDKTPDIAYTDNGKVLFCEVKTMCISQNEIIRRDTNGYIDRSIYVKLQPEFFCKLIGTINEAKEQIDAKGEGLVFVLIRLDDFAQTYINTYREQITSFVSGFNLTKLVIKLESTGEVFFN